LAAVWKLLTVLPSSFPSSGSFEGPARNYIEVTSWVAGGQVNVNTPTAIFQWLHWIVACALSGLHIHFTRTANECNQRKIDNLRTSLNEGEINSYPHCQHRAELGGAGCVLIRSLSSREL
jgi:hypothetical protein